MKKLLYLAIMVLILASLVLSGCGSPTTSPATSSPATPPTTSKTTLQTTPPTGPQRGGVLKLIVEGQNPDNFGYPVAASPTFQSLFSQPAIDPLYTYDKNGFPIPYLATGGQFSQDLLSFTFTIPNNLKFQDGTDLNAQAVKQHMEAHSKGPRPELKNLKSIEVINDYTVRLNLTKFEALLLSDIAKAAGLIVSPTAIQKNGTDWALTNPVGAGPFKLTNFTRNVSVTYERWDGYYQQGKPYLDGIHYIIMADQVTAKAAFLAGEADVILPLKEQDASDIKKTGKFNITTTSAGIVGIAGDSVHPDSPFSKLAVRQALSYAIDNQAIVDAIGFGFLNAANQHATPDGLAYNPDIKGYPYNPQKAKELLASAGYPSGFETKLSYTSPTYQNLVVAVQSYLKAVGITVTLDPMTSTKNTALLASGWQNSLVIYSGQNTIGIAPIHVLRRNIGASAAQYISFLRPQAIVDAINAGLVEPDQQKMASIVKGINKMIIDDYSLFSPIYSNLNIVASYPYVHDIKIYQPFWDQWSPMNAWLSK